VLDWDDVDSRQWRDADFGGSSDVAVEWIAFGGRDTLRSSINGDGNFASIRTNAFPAEDWTARKSMTADFR